jgi:quercetin dioxygenase-like cupin family protein
MPARRNGIKYLLMKHHDWNKVQHEQLNAHVGRKVVHLENMTIALIDIRKHAAVPEHHHVHEQVSMVQKGALKFRVDGREQIVREGEFLRIPPHAPHSVEALEDSLVLDIFAPVREDWIRGDDAYLRG